MCLRLTSSHEIILRQERQQSIAEEDDLDSLENVTSDIKEWLTSTFATKQQVRCIFLSFSPTFLSHLSAANKKVSGGPEPQVCGECYQNREVSGEDLQQYVLQTRPHLPG